MRYHGQSSGCPDVQVSRGLELPSLRTVPLPDHFNSPCQRERLNNTRTHILALRLIYYILPSFSPTLL